MTDAQTHGEIVSWSPHGTFQYGDIVNALNTAGALDGQAIDDMLLSLQLMDQDVYDSLMQRTKQREADPAKAAEYKQFVLRKAEEFGLERGSVEAIERPMLVQVRRTQVDRIRFAQEANEGTAASMSATELARQDASRLSNRLLSLFQPSEAGEINLAANRDFLREFAREVVPTREIGRFVDAEGRISQEGIARVRNALFARVFDDPQAIARLAESADVNIRNIQSGILQALPRLVKLPRSIGV